MRVFQTTLPWPPSVNATYRAHNGRVILSERYRRWREAVADVLTALPSPRGFDGRVALSLELRPGTRRGFDLDNRVKPVQDALVHAGILGDDEQVDRLEVVRGPYATAAEKRQHGPFGHVLVTVEELVP